MMKTQLRDIYGVDVEGCLGGIFDKKRFLFVRLWCIIGVVGGTTR